MNMSLRDGGAGVLLVLLLFGCSASEGGQPAETVATVAAPQAAPAASGTAAPGGDGTGPATPATSSAPPAAQSAGAPATTGSVQAPAAQPNQADQAGLAGQWEETAIEVPETEEPAPQPGVDKQPVVAAQHTAIGQTHATPSHPANMGVATHIGHHASVPGTQVAAPQLAHAAPSQVAHAAPSPAVQSVAAQRRARIALLASRFNRPVLLSSSDTPAPPPHVMSLKMGNVGISNFDDTARVNFALKASGSDAWANDYIDPRDSREFGCGLAGECQFWMQTGDKSPVYYMMHHDHRYAIFWDQQKAIWDLRLAEQGP